MDGDQRKPVIADAFNTRNEATVKLVKECSINLWKRINAGYVTPKREPIGLTHDTYQYKPELLDKKSYEHHRRRDSFTDYAEAAARLKNIFGSQNKNKQAAAAAGSKKKNGKNAGGKPPAGEGKPAAPAPSSAEPPK